MRWCRSITILLILVGTIGTALGQTTPLARFLTDPALKGAHVGLLVQTVGEPAQTLYAYQEALRFMPASTAKLFTAALALEKLGTDFVFTTPLLADAEPVGDTLPGSLYLKGVGDPSFSRDHLKALANALVTKGIRTVKGDLVIDVSAFEGNRWGTGWSWDYLHYGYAAEVWSLALDRNSVTLQILPAPKPNEIAQVTLSPPTNWLILDNRIQTVAKGTDNWQAEREPWERVIRLWGQIPLNAPPQTVRLSVPSVPYYVGETFRSLLKDNGIVVGGNLRVGFAPDTAISLAEVTSPPLADLIRWLNKVSDNLYAEMLLRTTALKERKRGSVFEALQVLSQQLEEWGIEPTEVRLVDGSGLSRLNLVTPRALVRLLQVARTRPWFAAFRNSLPVAGKDGTLRNRFRNTSAEGRVFAKTGYIGSVVALAGYLQRTDGTELVFAVLVNHYTAPTGQVQAAVDRFVAALVEQPLPITSPAASN